MAGFTQLISDASSKLNIGSILVASPQTTVGYQAQSGPGKIDNSVDPFIFNYEGEKKKNLL